jgi:HAE1 family hydrophobic/amphiphilic exporter-1
MFSKIFIERPRLAMVISILLILGGLIAVISLPVAEYPSITPPVIRVRAVYPGASAQVVKDTVAAPIEQEMNGVEDMLYMHSDCTNNGGYSLEVTFAVDSHPDIDQVNVQNRLQLAESQLPQEVLDQGITVRRRSSDMLGAVAFTSPNGTRSRLFLSNYVSRNIKDALQRIDGVSDVYIFGQTEYSMRIWMDPDKLTSLQMSPDELIQAIRQQNIQATLGSVGTAPSVPKQKLQYTLKAQGRLKDPKAFENIIVRSNDNGGLVRVKDVAEVDLGSKDYSAEGKFDNTPAILLALYRSSDANALETMQAARAELKRQAELMPEDMDYTIPYDTTEYVKEAIHEIVFTLGLTFGLVVLVIFIFLQNVRATIIPAAAVPVSIIGTFAVLLALGFNLNTISLFALILAIGLVVDDAIVVVENVHRIMEEEKLGGKEATIKAMTQVTGPIVATTLVLLAIFVPIAFMPGITGLLYKQFGVTLCVSVVISSICALTLSPALCGVLLKEPKPHRRGPFGWFNSFLGGTRKAYTSLVAWLIRHLVVGILLFLIVAGGTWFFSGHVPSSFLPQEDKGGFFIDVQLPEGASLKRTDEVTTKVTNKLLAMEGVEYVLAVNGFSLLSGRAENVGFVIADLDPWGQRKTPELSINALVGKAVRQLNSITTARILAFVPPPIQGLGTTGGFDFRLQALEGQSPQELASVAMGLAGAANQDPALSRVYTTFTADTPQIFVDLERTRMEELGVAVSQVFKTLSQQLGSQYVNDFNLYGRTYQVKVRAQAQYRKNKEDIMDLYVRSDTGKEVPVENLISLSNTIGARVINRYNQFSSAALKGEAAQGYSSGQAMAAMERLSKETLPDGYSFEWSTMSYQEQKASGTVGILFALAVIFAYLFLVALYESWNLPLSIVLSVIVASLGAFIGLWIAGHPLSIYAQIGMVLLVGLAAKNAILIVEFARDRKNEGLSASQAAVEGAGIRFRPVLMTALTFILGVAPLVWAVGAGASSRRHIGTVVFSGMIAATSLGLLIIPALYFLFQRFGEKSHTWREQRQIDKEMKSSDETKR